MIGTNSMTGRTTPSRAMSEQVGREPARHGRWLRLVPVIVAIMTGALLAPGVASAATSQYGFSGDAYGTQVNVGSLVKSGPSALVTLGCTTETGVSKSNTVATVNVPDLVTTGTIVTTADTLQTNTGVATRTTADTQNVNLLGGLIQADLVKAVSTTSHDASGFQVSAAGSTFVNLVVAGSAVSATTAPNTTITLLGLGKVVLNEQTSFVNSKRASLTVNMIHVYITDPANPLGIPTGTEIVISHARSALGGPVVGVLDGFAFGTKVNALDSLLISGPSAPVYMPCLGTNGVLKTNEVATINVPGVFDTGTVKDTAQGTVSLSSATGETTSTIQSVDLLSGLVTATVVKADAHASSDGTTPTFSDAGSGFLTLSVSGHPEITADVGPNTKVTLAGIGTLWLHRVITTSTSIEVRMIDLIITDASNPAGLAIGTHVQVAVAHASVHT